MAEQEARLKVNMTVNEGQLDAFKSIAQTMTEGCRSEPGTLGYEWSASTDGTRYRLVETESDSRVGLPRQVMRRSLLPGGRIDLNAVVSG